MRKIFKTIMNPYSVLRRMYMKFYLTPKYKKTNKKTHSKLLSTVGCCDANEYEKITSEVLDDANFISNLESKFTAVGVLYHKPKKYDWPITLYYLIRKWQLKRIVETGVFYGVSTSLILRALQANDCGRLYSIDLPAYAHVKGTYNPNPYRKEEDCWVSLPDGMEPGFIIPQDLRKRWDLRLGLTEHLLPGLLNEIGKIDLFLHDSLHTYGNMMFEFRIAYKYLREGGIIASDNIDWNNAYYDFCKECNVSPITYLAYLESPKLHHNFGIIKKLATK